MATPDGKKPKEEEDSIIGHTSPGSIIFFKQLFYYQLERIEGGWGCISEFVNSKKILRFKKNKFSHTIA